MRGIELGREDAVALCSAGIALSFVAGDLERGGAANDGALALNPNMAWAWLSSSLVKVWLGEPEVGIEHAARAMRLSPHDTQIFVMQTATAMAHFFVGRYTEALSWAEKASLAHADYVPAPSLAAASAALAGNRAAAASAIESLRRLSPARRLERILPLRRAEDLDRWREGLKKAGLSD